MQDLTTEMIDSFTESLRTHIANVQKACTLLGVSTELSQGHDLSKWERVEFLPYVRQFKGPADDPDGFAVAWLHHLHNNPHHWQYWMFPDEYQPAGSRVENGRVEMPQAYCLEMIADWLGASMAYTGSWNMRDWLWKNFTRVKLHTRSFDFVIDTLSDLGYYGILIEMGCNPKAPNLNRYPILTVHD